jgi:hypothetical protein
MLYIHTYILHDMNNTTAVVMMIATHAEMMMTVKKAVRAATDLEIHTQRYLSMYEIFGVIVGILYTSFVLQLAWKATRPGAPKCYPMVSQDEKMV